ncbi:MAG: gamma carbonic anhydrase family protein [Nitrospirae bacterium]|nr:gamma carbonic anhydrase family protein [Nitrospirota bacterium]MDA1304409.1 gamma carbonic anhydrase family protein [Nitrospirota bacterium]
MIKPYRGVLPTIATSAFVEDTAVVVGDVVIDSESSVWFNTVIRGDVHYIRIGHRTNIQDLSLLHVTHDTHPLIIGDDVTVGHHVTLHGCTIRNRVLIGMGSIVMDGAIIADDCIIGAGSLVTEGTIIPSHSLAIGSPARVKRPLNEKEVAWLKESASNYVQYASQYLTD